jgi:beta-lactam-binding protein with PASTA domain
MLRQALAARRSAIDRGALADATAEQPPRSGKEPAKPAASVASIVLPAQADSAEKRVSVEVPEVAGLRVRAAALALHRRGFRVRITGSGVVVRSDPAAGELVETGRVVMLHAGPAQ